MRRVHRVSALLLVAGGLLVLPAGAGAAVVTASPTSLTFAAQAVGTTSAAQQVTLTKDCTGANNTQCLPMGTDGPTFNTAISVPAPFKQTNNCPVPFTVFPDAKASCTINVTFAPTAATVAYGTLTTGTLTSGAPGPTASLTGTGTAAPTSGAKKKCKAKKGAAAAKKKKCKKKKKK